ncbi:MAG: hypothetical protein Q9197_002891 [Variospora fuerteventurae]
MAKATAAFPPTTHPTVLLRWLMQKHPELSPVFYLDLWPVSAPMILVIDPIGAAQITAENSLPKHPSTEDFLDPVIGYKNLVSMEGKEWKMWRGIFNPGFSSAHLMSLVGLMVDRTVIFTKILEEYAAKETLFELENAAAKLIIDIMGGVVLDTPLRAQTSDNELVRAFDDQLKWIPRPNEMNPFRKYSPWKFIESRTNAGIMSRYLGKVLEERFAARRQDEKTHGSSKRAKPIIDLALDTYLRETQQSGTATLPASFKRVAIAQFKTFLFAGYDTTSSTACFIIHLLNQNPEALEKVCQEHDQVFGSDTAKAAQAISDDHFLLNKLPYTTAVLKEVLRLRPPASTARQGQRDVFIELDGKRYPTEDFLVWPATYPLHRRPDIWPYADEFIPERFLVKEGDPLFPVKGAWRPFEQGPRSCIGQELVYIELKIFMVLTLRSFDIRAAYEERDRLTGLDNSALTVDGDRAYQVLVVTAKPSGGYPAKVTKRSR